MSYRLRRNSRAEGDREIHGGPLTQKRFDGGMNIDDPASEIETNQLAYIENYICKKDRLEARPGSVLHGVFRELYPFNTTLDFPASVHAYCYNRPTFTGDYADFGHLVHESTYLTLYKDYPLDTGYNITLPQLTYDGTSTAYGLPDAESTLRPYNKGFLAFTTNGIYYADQKGVFLANAANPVFGLPTDQNASPLYVYRYLVVLSRIVDYSQAQATNTTSADRNGAAAVVQHESGTNDKFEVIADTSTERKIDYAEIYADNPISSTNSYVFLKEDLKHIFSSNRANLTDNGTDLHWTHCSIYRTLNIKSNVIDNASSGNSPQVYVWVADYKRSLLATDDFTDITTDEVLQSRLGTPLYTLKTREFKPLPNGVCGEVGNGFIFVSDRSNASPENVLYYGAISSVSDENIGYYFPSQNQVFRDGIRAIRIIDNRLCIWCNSSSHICDLGIIESNLSELQYIPLLTSFEEIDGTLGIKDWATVDVIDRTRAIAVCSDSTVRIWNNGRWGDDLSQNTINTEIRKIVPASTAVSARGSFGIYYNGAYYLWYSKNTADGSLKNCLRFGFDQGHGSGWSFYTGYINLPFKCGAQRMIDSVGMQRLIAICGEAGNSTGCQLGYFYWLETFDMYTGAQEQSTQIARINVDGMVRGTGNESYGNEISCAAKFRELTGEEESFTVVHEETHTYYRPLVEADGYRTAFSLTMDGYKNGSPTTTDTMTALPKTGDLHFKKEVAARRVQLKLSTAAGAHSIVGIDSHCRVLDRINYATSGDISSSESTTSDPQHQAALGAVTVWHTRRDFGINRATGLNFAINGSPILVNGPDGKTNSATIFNNVTYTVANVAGTTTSAILFGVKSPDTNVVFLSIGTLSSPSNEEILVKFTDSTTLSISGHTITVATIGDGAWHLFALIKSGTSVSVYQNNVLKGTVTFTYTTFTDGPMIIGSASASTLKLFDVRYYNTVLTAAQIGYWYSDIINNSGDAVCPMV